MPKVIEGHFGTPGARAPRLIIIQSQILIVRNNNDEPGNIFDYAGAIDNVHWQYVSPAGRIVVRLMGCEPMRHMPYKCIAEPLRKRQFTVIRVTHTNASGQVVLSGDFTSAELHETH